MATKNYYVGPNGAEEVKAIASLPGLMANPSPLGFTNDRNGRGLARAFSASVFAYAAIMRKSRLMASVPLKVYRSGADGTPEEVPHPLTDRGALGPGSTSKLRDLYCDLDIFGRAYLLKAKGVLGASLTLTRLNPIAVTAIYEQGVKVAYEYKPNDLQHKRYTLQEVIYLSAYDPANDDGGLSPLAVALSAAGLDAATLEQAVAFFRNGANLSGMLTTDGAMSQPDIERLESAWKRVYGGIQNFFKTFIAWGGLKWQPMGVPPKDLALADLRQEIMNAICFVLQISPQLLSSDSTFANSKEARKAFYEDTAAPVLDLLADTLTGDPDIFRPGTKEFAAFDMSVLPAMADDEKGKFERAAMALQIGGSLNEAREIVGLDPLEGEEGEKRYIASNITPLEDDEEVPAPPPATMPPQPALEAPEEVEDDEAEEDDGEEEMEAVKAALTQWRESALDTFKSDKSAIKAPIPKGVPFELARDIFWHLPTVETAGEIRAVFERHWPRPRMSDAARLAAALEAATKALQDAE